MSSIRKDAPDSTNTLCFTPPPRKRFHSGFIARISTLLLCCLLLTEVLNSLPFITPTAYAKPPDPPAPATVTMQQFLQQKNPDTHYDGALIRPKQVPTPANAKSLAAQTAPKKASAEPAKMKGQAYTLDASFLLNAPVATQHAAASKVASVTDGVASAAVPAGSAPLSFKGSDGRLDVELPRGSIDLTKAVLVDGSAPVGALSLHITQVHGHYLGAVNLLGAYVVHVLDSQGHEVRDLHLTKPATIRYHYQAKEMAALNLNAEHVMISWPEMIAQAQKAKQATDAYALPMTNNASTRTLTAQTRLIGFGTLTAGAPPSIALPPTPHLASVNGNAGQLSYTYPLSVAPGPGGFAPQLALTYSSESTNERHDPRAPGSDVGEGWSLGLGSISSQTDSTGNQWYSIRGIGGVSDRLLPGPTAGNYTTEHISRLRIQFGNNCFHVWDPSGEYFDLGCTADAAQYATDSAGNKTYYRWDLDKVLAPYNSNTQIRMMRVTYLQDQTSTSGYTTIRDAGIKQILYGYATSWSDSATFAPLAGTVDFHYHAPSAQGSWADAYGSNYPTCHTAPPTGYSTTLRCDDPIQLGSVLPPDVMGTLTLDSVTSYVGDDSAANHKAYSYAMTYQDDFDINTCYSTVNLIYDFCAGSHLLLAVTPTVYQNGTGHGRKGLQLSYSGPLRDGYYDSSDYFATDNTQHYSGQTYWNYLTSYTDLDTGVGATASYLNAYGNPNGTPYVIDGNGNVDDRHDPLYCTKHVSDSDTSKRCDATGSVYSHPDNLVWSTQVVTQIQAQGSDSSGVNKAVTLYSYGLAVTGTNGCNPITGPGVPTSPNQTDCVGDNWTEPTSDWVDYFNTEFRGFNAVYVTSPAGNVTADYYYSTLGWGSNNQDGRNYNAGQAYQEDVYWGTNVSNDGALIRETTNTYTGTNGVAASCDGRFSGIHQPCEVMLTRSRTTLYEEGGRSSSAPWLQTDNTYADFNAGATPALSGDGYHNLLQTVTSSSNAATVTQKWSYQINDQVANSITYYHTNAVSHSEIDDAAGHVWKCQDISYDEGRAGGVPAPAAGWPTTVTSYSNCGNQSGTALKTYMGYDVYGNAIATIDPFATANSSLYSGNGCSFSTGPSYKPSAWTASRYTTCAYYDAAHVYALPVSQQNVLGQVTGMTYDTTQGDLPTSVTDVTGQTTSTGYSYDATGNVTLRVGEPGETGSYTTQSSSNSQCTGSSALPCYEVDANSVLYPSAVTRTYYDNLGRAVETRVPLDASNDTITFTVHDDVNNKTFQSVPFRYPHGSGWVDPTSATIDNGATAPAGTVTIYDPIGRVRAMQDPALGSTAEPGITCSGLSGTWTSCLGYGLGYAYGDSSAYYAYTTSHDANNHMTATFSDALGRKIYTFWYSTAGSVSNNITTKQTITYNALNLPTAVTRKDLAPQSGENPVLATASATYDDIGRVVSINDPDRGNHTLTYDADSRILADVSGTRTIGASYDLLGRVRCVQDAAPTNDGSGNCSGGSHPLRQDTYGSSYLQVAGTTDYSTGRLTQSIATTYYPDGTSATTKQQVEHDQRGRVIASNLQLGVPSGWGVTTALPTYLMTAAYNDVDQSTTTQTKVGAAAGYTFSQAYDSTTGMLKGLSNNGTGVANLATLSLDNHGMLSDLNFQTTTGSALANDHFTYDGNLRSVASTATWQSGSGSTGTIFSSNRSYDPVGNVVSIATTHATVPGQSGSGGSSTETFCYDEMNRLVWAGNTGSIPAAGNGTCGSATPSNSLSGAGYSNNYTYTHLGQIWQAPLNGTGAAQQYLYCDTNHPHQLTGVYPSGTTCANKGSATASYSASFDAWGNQTSRTYNSVTATLSYDGEDHLVKWDAGASNRAWYIYDASGKRVFSRSTTGSGTSLTVYAFGLEEHVYSATGTNTSNTYYYSLAGHLLGKFDGTSTQFYLTDAQGSVLSTFSAVAGSAAVVANQSYGPYGKQVYTRGAMGTSKGYTGQYNDATGLDYYNARYYDPVVGRFISADIIEGNLQGRDPYAYVHDNPETLTDPSGHAPPRNVYFWIRFWLDVLGVILDNTQYIPNNLKDGFNQQGVSSGIGIPNTPTKDGLRIEIKIVGGKVIAGDSEDDTQGPGGDSDNKSDPPSWGKSPNSTTKFQDNSPNKAKSGPWQNHNNLVPVSSGQVVSSAQGATSSGGTSSPTSVSFGVFIAAINNSVQNMFENMISSYARTLSSINSIVNALNGLPIIPPILVYSLGAAVIGVAVINVGSAMPAAVNAIRGSLETPGSLGGAGVGAGGGGGGEGGSLGGDSKDK